MLGKKIRYEQQYKRLSLNSAINRLNSTSCRCLKTPTHRELSSNGERLFCIVVIVCEYLEAAI